MSKKPKIDEVDAQILKTLLRNVRTSFSEIAKDCGMTSNSIRTRYNRLKKVGIIKGSTIQINPKKLGYDCISLLQIKTNLNDEKEVNEYLKKIPEAIMTARRVGTHNIHCFAAVKNNDELAKVVEKVKQDPRIIEVQQAIWIDVTNMDHPENLVIKKTDDFSTKKFLETEPSKCSIQSSQLVQKTEDKNFKNFYELDKNEIRLLHMVVENSRMSLRKMGNELGVSTQTAGRMFEKLKKNFISSSALVVDLEKMGYVATAVFSIIVAPGYEKSKVFKEIICIPNVIVAFKCLGAIDIHFVIPILNPNQIFEIKNEISRIPGVQELEIFFSPPYTNWPTSVFASLIPNQS